MHLLERKDTWFLNLNVLIRHHSVPRMRLYVPTEADCPVPLDYLDVVRETTTDLDRLDEVKIVDFWIADDSEHDRELSWWWTGSTTFYIRRPEPPPGKVYSYGDEFRKKQLEDVEDIALMTFIHLCGQT